MKKEYLPIVITISILIALNVFFNTLPLDGIFYLVVYILAILYIGNIRSQQKALSDRVSKLEQDLKNIEDNK